jgi:hypothetical protein
MGISTRWELSSIMWCEADDAYTSLRKFGLTWGFPVLKLVIDELWKKRSRSTIMTALSRKVRS